MPTYEYRCPKGHEFELFQRMSDPPVAACPQCGKNAERVLSGGAGLLFKGEGFYITDYRSDSYKKAAEKDRSAASGSKESSAGGDAKGGGKGKGSPGSSGSSSSGSSGSSGSGGSGGSGSGSGSGGAKGGE